MFLDGQPVGATKAKELGLVDEIVEGDLRAAAIAYAKRLVAEGKGAAPCARHAGDAAQRRRRSPRSARRRAKQHKGVITPELDIAAVRASWELPFEQGLAFERAISDGSLGTPESKAMRHLFFAEREVADVPGITGSGQAARHRRAAASSARAPWAAASPWLSPTPASRSC